jgi:hypothetical protein
MMLMVVGMMSIGTVLLNRSFLGLWVGPGYYGGWGLNLGIQLGLFAVFAFRIEALLLDALMDFRSRAIATMLAGGAGVLLAYALARGIGLTGIAIGTLAAHLALLVYLRRVIGRHVGGPPAPQPGLGRLAATVGVGIAAAAAIDAIAPVHAASWLGVAAWTVGIAATSALVIWWAGLNGAQRAMLRRRRAIGRTALRAPAPATD